MKEFDVSYFTVEISRLFKGSYDYTILAYGYLDDSPFLHGIFCKVFSSPEDAFSALDVYEAKLKDGCKFYLDDHRVRLGAEE